MDNVIPSQNDNETITEANDPDSIKLTENELSGIYNKMEDEGTHISNEIEGLTNVSNKINEVLNRSEALLDNPDATVTDEQVQVVHESFIYLAKQTPLSAYTEDAWTICLEANNIQPTSKLRRVYDNIVAFLKRLYRFIMEKISQVISLFRKGRYQLTTIVGKVLTRGEGVLKVFKDIQNKDKEFFNQVFKESEIEEIFKTLQETKVNPNPGLYLGVVTLDDILNLQYAFKELNVQTKQIIEGLDNFLLAAKTAVKNSTIDPDAIAYALYEEYKKIADVQLSGASSRQLRNVKDYIIKNKLDEKNTIKIFPLVYSRDNVTTLLLNNHATVDTWEGAFVVKDISITKLPYDIVCRDISLNELNKSMSFLVGMMEKELLANRDAVYRTLESFYDTLDLVNSTLKSSSVPDPENLKELTYILNKIAYPIICKMLIKQYLAMVINYNQRISYLEALVKELLKLKPGVLEKYFNIKY